MAEYSDMSLFTKAPLNDRYSKGMPVFDHLNVSSRASFARRRQLIDKWFAEYPDDGKAKLRSAFQVKNDTQHLAAFFELLVHEVLLEQGFSVILTDLSQHSKFPDFLVTREDGYKFYVEVCHSAEEKAGEQRRLDLLHHYINSNVRSKDFFLNLIVHHVGKDAPPSKRIATDLRAFLEATSYDDLVSILSAKNEASHPAWTYVKNGWNIKIDAWPKNNLRGQDDHNIIGVYGNTKGGSVDDDLRLRRSIETKANYYGALTLPFVIAANCMSEYSDAETAVWALYGRDSFLMQRSGENLTPVPWRANGAWLKQNRYWGSRRSSAVLYVSQATPLNVFGARACVFYHPEPLRDIEPMLPGLYQCKVDNGGFAYLGREDCTRLGVVLPDADDVERNEDYDD